MSDVLIRLAQRRVFLRLSSDAANRISKGRRSHDWGGFMGAHQVALEMSLNFPPSFLPHCRTLSSRISAFRPAQRAPWWLAAALLPPVRSHLVSFDALKMCLLFFCLFFFAVVGTFRAGTWGHCEPEAATFSSRSRARQEIKSCL